MTEFQRAVVDAHIRQCSDLTLLALCNGPEEQPAGDIAADVGYVAQRAHGELIIRGIDAPAPYRAMPKEIRP